MNFQERLCPLETRDHIHWLPRKILHKNILLVCTQNLQPFLLKRDRHTQRRSSILYRYWMRARDYHKTFLYISSLQMLSPCHGWGLGISSWVLIPGGDIFFFPTGSWSPAVDLAKLVSHFPFTFQFTFLPMLNNQRVPALGIFCTNSYKQTSHIIR